MITQINESVNLCKKINVKHKDRREVTRYLMLDYEGET